MDYENKYKEALEWARKVMQGKVGFVLDEVLEKFSELKESEDERIRKEILDCFIAMKQQGCFPSKHKEQYDSWINWLEKQGEQKPADKVEPKFHEDEWITNGDYTWKIVEVKPLDYILQSQDGNIVDDTISHVDEQFHSFTIQDAKDGDVLTASDGSIFLFKNTIDCACKHYVALTTDGVIKFNEGLEHFWETSRAVQPATKEQRNQLEKAMANDIEYIRKDAFIEKACEFLKSYRQDTLDGTGYVAGIVNDKTIEAFKCYMKGE